VLVPKLEARSFGMNAIICNFGRCLYIWGLHATVSSGVDPIWVLTCWEHMTCNESSLQVWGVYFELNVDWMFRIPPSISGITYLIRPNEWKVNISNPWIPRWLVWCCLQIGNSKQKRVGRYWNIDMPWICQEICGICPQYANDEDRHGCKIMVLIGAQGTTEINFR